MGLIDIDYYTRQPFVSKNNRPSAEVIQEAIDDASAYVEDYIDRKVLEREYIERIPGQRTYTILLDNYPITELSDVSWTDAFGNVGTHDLNDFLIHSEAGIIEYINKLYNFRGDRVYTFTYSAGYAEVPPAIKRATAYQTLQLLRPMRGGPLDNLPDVVPVADELITNLLERYRRKRIS
jgi:hypothetical protein